MDTSVRSFSVGTSFISKIKSQQILSRKEENTLFMRYHEETDEIEKEKIKESIILSNVRFVIKVAMEYRHHTIDNIDLISEGILGLIHAIDEYNVDSGNKFISYAVYWIRHYINTFIDGGESVKVPIGKVKKIRKIIKDGDLSDIDSNIDMRLAHNAMSNITYIDSPIAEDGKYTYSDIIEDEKNESVEKKYYTELLSKELVNIIKKKLSYPKDEIIIKTYGLGDIEIEKTLREISLEMPLSHERIRQLRIEAHEELRNCDELKQYLLKYRDMKQLK